MVWSLANPVVGVRQHVAAVLFLESRTAPGRRIARGTVPDTLFWLLAALFGWRKSKKWTSGRSRGLWHCRGPLFFLRRPAPLPL